jgi:hypothetical protein
MNSHPKLQEVSLWQSQVFYSTWEFLWVCGKKSYVKTSNPFKV